MIRQMQEGAQRLYTYVLGFFCAGLVLPQNKCYLEYKSSVTLAFFAVKRMGAMHIMLCLGFP